MNGADSRPLLPDARGLLSEPEALRTLASSASFVRCRRGQRLYAAGDRTEHWHRVISGMLRESTILGDGRRHVVEFLLPGDFFGLSAYARHRFTVEAIVPGTLVARYERRSLEQRTEVEPQLHASLLALALSAVARLQSRALVLGRLNARQRVGSFLAEMAERAPQEAGVIALPMSRSDIADYLALSVETVSRSLTLLRHDGAIALVDARRVKILDRAALAAPAD